MKTRVELDADIFQLRAAMPLWRRALASGGEFQAHCEYLAASIIESAAPRDQDYAVMQLRDALQHQKEILREFNSIASR